MKGIETIRPNDITTKTIEILRSTNEELTETTPLNFSSTNRGNKLKTTAGELFFNYYPPLDPTGPITLISHGEVDWRLRSTRLHFHDVHS